MRAALLVAAFALSLSQISPAMAARERPWQPGDYCRILPGGIICGPGASLPDFPSPAPEPDPKPKPKPKPGGGGGTTKPGDGNAPLPG